MKIGLCRFYQFSSLAYAKRYPHLVQEWNGMEWNGMEWNGMESTRLQGNGTERVDMEWNSLNGKKSNGEEGR